MCATVVPYGGFFVLCVNSVQTLQENRYEVYGLSVALGSSTVTFTTFSGRCLVVIHSVPLHIRSVNMREIVKSVGSLVG